MNKRINVIKRNNRYLKEFFSITEKEWLDTMCKIGKPENEYGNQWNPENCTGGWCGGVTKGLYYSGKIPTGYIPCKQNGDEHFYLINTETNEVIDLTIYQMVGEYEHDYTDYTPVFQKNYLSKNIKKFMDGFDLKVDVSKFVIKKNNYLSRIK